MRLFDAELRRLTPLHAEIARRYDLFRTFAEFLLSLATMAGSALLLFEELALSGTWILLIVSVFLAIRPSVSLVRELHLMRLPRPHGTPR